MPWSSSVLPCNSADQRLALVLGERDAERCPDTSRLADHPGLKLRDKLPIGGIEFHPHGFHREAACGRSRLAHVPDFREIDPDGFLD